MSSATDDTAQNRKDTRDALLAAIKREVEAIDRVDSQHNRVTYLKRLAEAYALVYHGAPTSD